MAEYPLLIFPDPAHADRAKGHGGPGTIRLPTAQRQAERLAPQFQRLQQAMDRQRLTLQHNTLGLQPEQVLVLETIGPIQNFINAVGKVEGLEWLGEFELDDISPDHGFEDEKDLQKQLSGQLFLVMTDQRALQELQSLFSGWQQNHDAKFPRGLAPLKHAFTRLLTIRPWDAQDRIRDTGLFEDWQLRAQYGQEAVPFEAELFFSRSVERRQQAEFYLRSVIEALDGFVVQRCVIPEIAYHGILGTIPMDKVSDIVTQRDVRLLQSMDIMYLRPVGQCSVGVPEDLSDTEALEDDSQPDLPQGEPLVALLDGLPMTGHRLLDGRLIVDDPDGYESAYQARERVHGTAMASLICHGDLGEGGGPAGRPLYVRPIMQPHRRFDGEFVEAIPEGVLAVDLVHRAVRRLYEDEGDEQPVAPSVRVINLSVCDRSQPFDRGVSSWARLLDWLSWKYNLLFVVSAGNHLHDIELNIPSADLGSLTAEEREKAVIEAIVADTRHRRLLAPAETFNGITLAATHADSSTPAANPNLVDPFARVGLPSTISAQGPGYRRTVKPDIFLPGGRQFLSAKPGNADANAILQTAESKRPPGQCVAVPGAQGELNRTHHTRGTSNAAAVTSRWANSLFDVIDFLRTQPGASLPSEYDVVLLKTLLVHGADWLDAGTLYESILKNLQNSRTFTDYVGRFWAMDPPIYPK